MKIDPILLGSNRVTKMATVTPDKILDTAVVISQVHRAIPFELWVLTVSFLVEKPRMDYIIINDQVIHIITQPIIMRTMTPIHLFRKRSLIPKMHRKTFGNKLQDSMISFDLFNGRKTIAEVMAL